MRKSYKIHRGITSEENNKPIEELIQQGLILANKSEEQIIQDNFT